MRYLLIRDIHRALYIDYIDCLLVGPLLLIPSWSQSKSSHVLSCNTEYAVPYVLSTQYRTHTSESAHIYIYISTISIYLDVCTNIYIYICLYIYIQHIYIYMYIYIYICICIYLYVYVYLYSYVYIYIYIFTILLLYVAILLLLLEPQKTSEQQCIPHSGIRVRPKFRKQTCSRKKVYLSKTVA